MSLISRCIGSARALSMTFMLGLAILSTGCGFQLKGSGNADNATTLKGRSLSFESRQPGSDLTRAITRELTNAGLILDERAEADLRLIVGPEQFTQRNLSLTAQARAAELELTLAADFTLFLPDQDPVDSRATVNRQMLNDPRNVVGKTEELRLLQEEMRRDLAAQITRRISYALAP
jgi:LPS-assembly lipoprotein